MIKRQQRLPRKGWVTGVSKLESERLMETLHLTRPFPTYLEQFHHAVKSRVTDPDSAPKTARGNFCFIINDLEVEATPSTLDLAALGSAGLAFCKRYIFDESANPGALSISFERISWRNKSSAAPPLPDGRSEHETGCGGIRSCSANGASPRFRRRQSTAHPFLGQRSEGM